MEVLCLRCAEVRVPHRAAPRYILGARASCAEASDALRTVESRFAACSLSRARSAKPTERDVLDEVMRWKQRQQPPMAEGPECQCPFLVTRLHTERRPCRTKTQSNPIQTESETLTC